MRYSTSGSPLPPLAVVLVAAIVGISQPACEDEESNWESWDGPGGSPERVKTGVGGDDQLASLSREDAEKVCRAIDAAYIKVFGAAEYCTVLAVSASEDTASCESELGKCRPDVRRYACGLLGSEELVQACLSAPAGTSNDANCDPARLRSAPCNVTVQELETCHGETIAQARRAIERLDCDLAGDSDALRREIGVQPTACRQVAQRCPELFR